MTSCDTFVVLPSATKRGKMIFGKNSDRPESEVQEVVYIKGGKHAAGSKLQTTYIKVDQAEVTYSVALSKPSWMWGAEIGANQHGVCIGNEAVFTRDMPADLRDAEKLLGMDLVRLGLERGKSARDAVTIMTSLLEAHGQGGPCYDQPDINMAYHNSFLVADGAEAWVLETAGKHWAAEKVEGKYRHISNLLSITTKIDLCSEGLQDHAKARGYWQEAEGPFDFAKAFTGPFLPATKMAAECSMSPERRLAAGKNLMDKLTAEDGFTVADLMSVLRDETSCISRTGTTATTGSQVSELASGGAASLHWFTATKFPHLSIFKPLVICDDTAVGESTTSPAIENDPAKSKPRFSRSVDRSHPLWQKHTAFLALKTSDPQKYQEVENSLRGLEREGIDTLQDVLASGKPEDLKELGDLFKDAVYTECKLYS